MTNDTLQRPGPSTCTLYRGDCIDVMPTLQAGSVAMVFADLPYGVTQNVWDSCIPLALLWGTLRRCLHPHAAALFTATQPFASTLVSSNPKNFRYDLIWQKGRPTGFFAAKLRPLRSHESILVFYEKPNTYNPQMQQGGRIYGKQMGGGPSKNYGTTVREGKKNSTGENYPRSVIAIPCVNNRSILHPTQKPVALLKWLIATYTNSGDTVLDPVFGSATTAIACAHLGRNFMGIEKDPEYFRIGRERVNAERKALGLSPSTVKL